jgi:hypothetical protein
MVFKFRTSYFQIVQPCMHWSFVQKVMVVLILRICLCHFSEQSMCYLLFDTIQVRSNSDFYVKWATIQFYDNSHNFSEQSMCYLLFEILHEISWHVVLPWVTISDQSEFGKALQYGSTEAVQILLFTSFWLVDFLFG